MKFRSSHEALRTDSRVQEEVTVAANARQRIAKAGKIGPPLLNVRMPPR